MTKNLGLKTRGLNEEHKLTSGSEDNLNTLEEKARQGNRSVVLCLIDIRIYGYGALGHSY